MGSVIQRMTVLANARSTRFTEDLGARIAALHDRYDVTLVEIKDPSTFGNAIEAASREADAIVVASGDGTLARSARDLIEADRPVGVLPLGNANDLARSLGLSTSVEQACVQLCDVRRSRLDVGVVNGHTFFSAATVGLGALVSSEMDVASKKRWRRLSQIPRLLRALRDRRTFGTKITCEEGLVHGRSIQMTIGNGRTIGGGVVLDEEARLDDAKLFVSSVRPQSVWSLLALAPDYVRGRRRDRQEIDTLSSPRFLLETSRPMDVATDGDVVTRTPARFASLPGAIEFLVPNAPEAEPALETPESPPPSRIPPRI